jgi:hypothetical protein
LLKQIRAPGSPDHASSWLDELGTARLGSWVGRQNGYAPPTTNQEADDIAFQRWYKFKEAFSPRFVADALGSVGFTPRTCLDPFGGSGTTALTCQFLNIRPTTIEVNPFLGDVIEAKLSSYDVDALIRDRGQVARRVAAIVSRRKASIDRREFVEAPPTLIEPGQNGRWIFDAEIASRLLAYRRAIDELDNAETRRLLRVILGSLLVPASNVVVNGKGRRYRAESRRHMLRPAHIDAMFDDAFQRSLYDVCRYGERSCREYALFRGDARAAIDGIEDIDVALFSPPYPNSFDYTDIYNVELWMLGYLGTRHDNRRLREATLRSHVQIKRPFGDTPLESRTLARALAELECRRPELWNADIPAMVRAYFEDLLVVLASARRALSSRGQVMLVVGDSRYAGVVIDVAKIIGELAHTAGLRKVRSRAVRSMRSSAQQGGAYDLRERLLTLRPVSLA